MKHILALCLALVFNAAANLMMKAGMNRVQAGGGLLKDGLVPAMLTVLGNPVLVIGLACFALNAACYMFALQSPALKISLAYPIMVGGGYAIIAIVAFAVLDERMSPAQWFGVLLVLAGVMTIALSTSPAEPVAQVASSRT